jgi:hypothetical protein
VSEPHKLLAVLEAAIQGDAAPPGFAARLAFGVKSGEDTHWLEVVLGDQATSEVLATPNPACDGSLLLGASDADAILSTGHLPESPELLDAQGDRDLLTRFVNRYLVPKSPLSVRIG